MKKTKILTVFGTRPEVIKMAPVVKELQNHKEQFVCRVCITAQHRQMIDSLLALFEIHGDYDLNIMAPNQTLGHITTTILTRLGEIIDLERPDWLIVQGDTTTAMAASLAAFYKKVKIAHVEAGLRTGNKNHPYPEEVNRKIIDSLGDLYFAHTEGARRNLLAEGIAEGRIEVTGNTVIDALLEVAGKESNSSGSVLEKIPLDGKKIILVTAHRRENHGTPIVNVCSAIREIALRYPSEVCFIYPVHLNPNVRKTVLPLLDGIENVFLTEPLDYAPFVHLMKRCYCILTDSGGIQEEAPSLGKPVLVLRETTERPEAVEAGGVEMVGTQPERIVQKTVQLLEDSRKYERMSRVINPYGDGQAGVRIVKRLLREAEHV
jgi:UDP-N-acetylglucosamine 2-epimerase (non-hydrolysing)